MSKATLILGLGFAGAAAAAAAFLKIEPVYVEKAETVKRVEPTESMLLACVAKHNDPNFKSSGSLLQDSANPVIVKMARDVQECATRPQAANSVTTKSWNGMFNIALR